MLSRAGIVPTVLAEARGKLQDQIITPTYGARPPYVVQRLLESLSAQPVGAVCFHCASVQGAFTRLVWIRGRQGASARDPGIGRVGLGAVASDNSLPRIVAIAQPEAQQKQQHQ